MNNVMRHRRARRITRYTTIISIVALGALLLPATPAFASWTASTSGTNVTLSGNAADDLVTIGVDQDGWLTHGISSAPFASTRDWSSGALGEQLVAASGSYNLTIGGGGGNDVIILTGASGLNSITANGGPGNDFIYGSALADGINGGTGHDHLEGERGADTVRGGDGNDEMVMANGDGSDNVAGNAGTDRLEISGRATGGEEWVFDVISSDLRISRVSAGPVSMRPKTMEEVHLNTLGGADEVRFVGAAADEAWITVDGHFDNDRLKGGSGPETLDGGENDDVVLGGNGPDDLTGGRGKDRIEGGDGGDDIDAQDGVEETVLCGKGRDRVRADKSDHLKGCERVNRS